MGIKDKFKDLFTKKENIEKCTNDEENKKTNSFLEDIKINKTDYLNPEICKGNNLVPNILRHLGVSEDIIKNPRALYEIEYHLKGVISKDNLRLPEVKDIPTIEYLEKLVDSIKNNQVLSKEERLDIFAKTDRMQAQKAYYGISIEEDLGAVAIQKLDITGVDRNESFISNKYDSTTYYHGGSGKVFADKKSYKVDNLGERPEEYLCGATSTIYNQDGLIMSRSSIVYEEEDEIGVSKVKYNSRVKRDSQYPFVAEHKTLVNNRSFGFPVGEKYILIDLKRLDEIGSCRNKEKIKTREPIEFETREDIEEYYQKNKELIRESIENGILNDGRYPETLKQKLDDGIRKMGEEQLHLLLKQQTIEDIVQEL